MSSIARSSCLWTNRMLRRHDGAQLMLEAERQLLRAHRLELARLFHVEARLHRWCAEVDAPDEGTRAGRRTTSVGSVSKFGVSSV